MKTLAPGAAVLYDEPLERWIKCADDLIYYAVPYDKLAATVGAEAKLRKLIKNMIYVGVAAQLLEIDYAEVEKAIRKQFATKAKAANLNLAAAKAGHDYAAANLKKRDPFYIQRMDKTKGKIIVDGNSAAALGCMFAGCTVVTWYPITPSSSLVETMIDYMKEHRIGPDGKATFAIVQAEDELAAVGMVIGAAWAGARSMTATAGPGISLMAEFTGLAYYVEDSVRGVGHSARRAFDWTCRRARRKAMCYSTAFLSHGDTKHIMLFPNSVGECFSMAQDAFDLAERFQTPVFVMSDLDLGMNNWMSDPFPYPEKPIDRGKVLTKEDIEKAGGFARYKDVDGDGIGYRTLPGTDHPAAAYFARGSGHNEKAQYSERPDDFERNMERINKKFETARSVRSASGSWQRQVATARRLELSLTAQRTGRSSNRATSSRKNTSCETDYLRLRSYPFTREVHEFIEQHERIYVVEQNRDGQMASLLKLDIKPELTPRLAVDLPHSRTADRCALGNRRTHDDGG